MKTLLLSAILGGLLLVGTAFAASTLETQLAAGAFNINAHSPDDRGGGIILDGAKADGKTLTYFYHFTHNLPEDILGHRQHEMTEGLCRDQDAQYVFVNGGTIKMIWRNLDGTIAHLILANEEVCDPAYSWGPGTY